MTTAPIRAVALFAFTPDAADAGVKLALKKGFCFVVG
jgi:hypothetical protein